MSFFRRVFINQVIHFWKKFGISGKGPFTEKAKMLIEVPYVSHLKVQVLSFNMNNVFLP